MARLTESKLQLAKERDRLLVCVPVPKPQKAAIAEWLHERFSSDYHGEGYLAFGTLFRSSKRLFKGVLAVTTPKIKTARCGNTLYVFDETEEQRIAQVIEQRMLKGAMQILNDGTKRWIEYDPVIDTTKEGSEQYKWDKSGNKVLTATVQHELRPNGEHSKIILKRSYRRYE